MEDARIRSNRMLDEYMTALEQTFEEHKADARRHADMLLRQETEKSQREINKKLSFEQIGIKRTLGMKQEELKDKLFVELRDKLASFMETPDYQKLLIRQIQAAVDLQTALPLPFTWIRLTADKLNRLALHHGIR